MPNPISSFLRKRKYGDDVIVVSGLPRSGTSMMMKMLDASGLPIMTDHERTADEDNPKGYFEFERVKDLDKGGDKSWVADHRGKVVKIISFLLKDLPDDNYYKVIFMRRDLDEVLASQNKMLVRRGEQGSDAGDEEMKRLYTNHLGKVQMMFDTKQNFELLDVHYRQVIENPREQAEAVARFLELSDRTDAMAGAVSGSSRSSRASREAAISNALSSGIRESCFSRGAGSGSSAPLICARIS